MLSTLRQLDLRSKPDGAFFVRLLFVVGSILGCAVGFYFCGEMEGDDLNSFVLDIFLFDSFALALLHSFKYVALLVLFGTSCIGVLLVPSLSLVYAYSLSSCVASGYLLYGSQLLPYLLVCFVVPAFITLPCFFIIADSMFAASKKLYFFSFFDIVIGGSDKPVVKILLCALAMLLVGAYHYFAVPMILELLF